MKNSNVRNLFAVIVPLIAVVVVAGNAYAADVGAVSQTNVTPAAKGSHVRQYRFTGAVDAISSTSWSVGGKTFVITSTTQIATGIKTGDTAKVVYYISGVDNVATKITLISAAPVLVSFSGTVWPIINTNCVGCHKGSSASAGVDLSSYSSILHYVTPYDAAHSTLYNSLTSMPPGGSLSSTDKQAIADWINQGALNN